MDVNKSNPEIQFGDKIFIPNPKQVGIVPL